MILDEAVQDDDADNCEGLLVRIVCQVLGGFGKVEETLRPLMIHVGLDSKDLLQNVEKMPKMLV